MNLDHYDLLPNVKKVDMLQSTEHFDVSILDLPYGHSSVITKEEQTALITKVKEISDRAVIISMEDMSETLQQIGFTIIDSCKIKKSNVFSRYVTVCV